MYIPGPSINILGTSRFVQRPLLFTEQKRIVRKPPKTAGEDESKPGYLCWGQVGDLPSAEAVPEVSFEVHEEVSRETTPARIENPDDAEQHVDVDQTNSMKLKKTTPGEKNNTATRAADLSGVDADKRPFVISGSSGLKATDYEYQMKFNPPERAV
jgi:hypothetical protein